MNEYEFDIGIDDRVGFIGITGSGKTFLAVRFLNQFSGPHVKIVDTKHALKLKGFKVTYDEKEAIKGEKIIYRPKGITKPRESFYDGLWNRYANKRKPKMLLYLDESADITSPQFIPDKLQLIVQAGRELGMGVWFAAQAPTKINNWLLSQSSYVFVFKLPVESDRKKLRNEVGDTVMDVDKLPPYHYHAYGFPEVEGITTSDGTETYVMQLES